MSSPIIQYSILGLILVSTAILIGMNAQQIEYTTSRGNDGSLLKHAYAKNINAKTLLSIHPDTTSLYLDHAHLNDEDLKKLPKHLKVLTLKALPIHGTGFQHLPSSLEELHVHRLETLDLNNLKYLAQRRLKILSLRLFNETDNRYLNDLPYTLNHLGIFYRCALNREGLRALKHRPLHSLHLDRCSLSKESYEVLISMPLLKLTLNESNITDEILLRLPRTLQELIIYNAPNLSRAAMKTLTSELWHPQHIQFEDAKRPNESFKVKGRSIFETP